MNFLNFLTSGLSKMNFNLQNSSMVSAPFFPTNSQTTAQNEKEKGAPEMMQWPSIPFQGFGNPLLLEAMLQKERQEIINRYLQGTIEEVQKQELQQQQMTPPKQDSIQVKDSEPVSEKTRYDATKKIKKVNKCGHEDRQHYAKGYCKNCYLKYGRTKKPWNCSHEKLYAAGMCQNCYINQYNKKKRESHLLKQTKQEHEQ